MQPNPYKDSPSQEKQTSPWQVDATAVSVGFGVEFHQFSSSWKWTLHEHTPTGMLPAEALMSINRFQATRKKRQWLNWDRWAW